MPSDASDRPNELLQHFGRDGLRLFGRASLIGTRLPAAAQALLEETGVPRAVAPYFTATAEGRRVRLGVVAAQSSEPRPHEAMEDWPRVGFDGLAHLCVRPDGAVQGVVLSTGADDMFVNTDVSTFGASLMMLDRALPLIASATALPQAAGVFRDLNAQLRQIDAAAFAERESWWPRVLDDIRHTLNFPFSAAFEYIDATGAKQVETAATGPGSPHPEEIIWQRLAQDGVEPRQVTRVYCELEPCTMPGHYCAVWLQRTFPEAKFTHSFDYGDTAESREEGLKALITHAAKESRRG
ncbi:nucleic acid/nucleotide deaminase domain-containing protein [Streptomyces sp. NPDC058049]|uniref:nucleic acid/nucleotide deaminase domain-containing protein n=1 Tax=Streptomyces sp. NPDC058049 TaxID=3346314 RepID=UPI0036E4DF0E